MSRVDGQVTVHEMQQGGGVDDVACHGVRIEVYGAGTRPERLGGAQEGLNGDLVGGPQRSGLFGGPDRLLIRSCPAPGCVLYFLREHPRREWCSTTCGNRVRAARHYDRSK